MKKCYDRDKIGPDRRKRAVGWCKAAGCCPKILTLEQSAESPPRQVGETVCPALLGRPVNPALSDDRGKAAA